MTETRGLRRFTVPARGSAPKEPEPERCGLCGETLMPQRHGHLVDVRNRSLVCACTACALLFTRDGAAGGHYRTVPDRILRDQETPLTEAGWATLRIPVAIAFFFLNSDLGRIVASYPSPAGVTECELDLAAWDQVAAEHPLLRELAPDTEAILVIRGQPGTSDDHGIETYLIPVDMCYALAGALRLNWHGFDGGSEVRQTLGAFLADLRQRSREAKWQS
jgi:Family of unknown function (DUF5947)